LTDSKLLSQWSEQIKLRDLTFTPENPFDMPSETLQFKESLEAEKNLVEQLYGLEKPAASEFLSEFERVSLM